MPVLNFKEIPEAHLGGGRQDTFELFARDFLEYLGYKVVSGPSRGADGGVDLVVEEYRSGVGGVTVVRWLVSCKHKAHSGKSVNPADDSNIRDRVAANSCSGFIGFYSTLASSGLASALENGKTTLPYQIFDGERIEAALLNSSAGLKIASRYFPKSFSAWMVQNPRPAPVFSEMSSLECAVCGKELLYFGTKGIVVFWYKVDRANGYRREEYTAVNWVCRGHCDHALKESMRANNRGVMDVWEDINDLLMPVMYIRAVMAVLNNLRSGIRYSDEAFAQMKDLLLQIYPFVARHPSDSDNDRVQDLARVPAELGGLGF